MWNFSKSVSVTSRLLERWGRYYLTSTFFWNYEFFNQRAFFLLRVLPELKGFVNSHRKQPESKKALEISTPQEFEAQIVSGTSLVNFYTADCEASKKLAPTIDKLATQYANTADIEVVKVDCGKQELQGLCENEEVSTFSKYHIQNSN